MLNVFKIGDFMKIKFLDGEELVDKFHNGIVTEVATGIITVAVPKDDSMGEFEITEEDINNGSVQFMSAQDLQGAFIKVNCG